MLTDHDPHFALGREHARARVPAYRWQDTENQRRYDAGYLAGLPAPASSPELDRMLRALQGQGQGLGFAQQLPGPRKP
jgi:hypothetical protein